MTADPYQKGFFLVSLIFLFFQVQIDYQSSLSSAVELSSLADLLLLFAYSAVFLLYRDRLTKGLKITLKALAAFSIVNLLIAISLSGAMSRIILVNLTYSAVAILFYFPLLIFALFLISIGYLTFRSRYKAYAYLFLVFAIVSSFYLYYYVNLQVKTIPSDETFIAYAETKPLLNGLDPYSNNVANILYSNYTTGEVTSPTYTTLNEITGVLNYPALYLLVSVPFYLISNQVSKGFAFATKIQGVALIIPLLFLLALSLERRHSNKPVYGLVFLLAYLTTNLSTPTEFLMLFLLLLAYTKLDSRYSWLFLGLCISIQQILWLPALLLIAYTVNNQGLRKGAYDALGALFTFLLINSYFLSLNPSAFIRGISNTLNGPLFPSSETLPNYLITVAYGTELNIVPVLFGIVVVLLLVALLYYNNKRLIGLFSLLPLLFTLHANLYIYSVFFSVFTYTTLFLRDNNIKNHGHVGNWLRKKKSLLYSFSFLLVLLTVLILSYSHYLYNKNFYVSVTDQRANLSASTEFYSAKLNYRSLSNNTLYATIFALGNRKVAFYPFLNLTDQGGYIHCNQDNSACRISARSIRLSPGNSSYNLTEEIDLTPNLYLYRQQLILYNGDHVYVSKPI